MYDDDPTYGEEHPEYDIDPCSACGGPAPVMGVLGRREWRRCRNCGMDSSKDLGEVLGQPSASRAMRRKG